jgi:site-specific recombinase XerD
MGDRLEVSGDARPVPFGALSPERFDNKTLTPFYERSVSEETRRAYRRVVREFSRFLNHRDPSEITPADVLRWRDRPSGIISALSYAKRLFPLISKS